MCPGDLLTKKNEILGQSHGLLYFSSFGLFDKKFFIQDYKFKNY